MESGRADRCRGRNQRAEFRCRRSCGTVPFLSERVDADSELWRGGGGSPRSAPDWPFRRRRGREEDGTIRRSCLWWVPEWYAGLPWQGLCRPVFVLRGGRRRIRNGGIRAEACRPGAGCASAALFLSSAPEPCCRSGGWKMPGSGQGAERSRSGGQARAQAEPAGDPGSGSMVLEHDPFQ